MFFRIGGIDDARLQAWMDEHRVLHPGERLFRPDPRRVNFVLGTDQHGFLLGTVHGNGSMPFPHVTLHEVPIDAWSQLVVVKDERGYQQFYANGTLVRSDRDASARHRATPSRPFSSPLACVSLRASPSPSVLACIVPLAYEARSH